MSLYKVNVPKLNKPLEKMVKGIHSKGWHEIEGCWVFFHHIATGPKELGKGFSPHLWPLRSTLALNRSLGDDEWVQLEHRVDYANSVNATPFVHQSTTIATIYHPPEAAAPAATSVEEFVIASDDESAGDCAIEEPEVVITDLSDGYVCDLGDKNQKQN